MQTLEKILSTAVDLFRQYGFKTITMDDIARGAGISKKTLYQHFANKEDIVTEAVSWFHAQTFVTIERMLSDSANAIEGMVQIMAMFDAMYRKINPMALLELQRFFPAAYRTFREQSVAKDVASLTANINQGITEGYYREGLDAGLLARFRIDTCLMLFQPNGIVTEGIHHNSQDISRQLSEHFLYGLMTAKGEKLYIKYKDQYFQKVHAS